VSDWERTHVELPIYRNRRRGGLWLVKGKLLFLPGASLNDLVALVQSVDEINNPPAAEPSNLPPVVEKHDFPRFVTPHPSRVEYFSGGAPVVEGFKKIDINRDTGIISVLVRDAAEEARLTAIKGWKK
jgi:hypothetical protein